MSDIPQNLTQSYDPSVAMSGDTALLQLFKTFQTELNICIPCIVEEVKEDGRVKVKPLMKNKWSTADGAVDIDRPSFTVPCIKYLHGGFLVHGPISKGDTGWVIAGDRDPVNAITANSSIVVDGKTNNKGPVALTSLQMNQFAFGFFIPDSWAKLPKAYDDMKENFSFGTADGKTYVTITKDGECNIRTEGIEFKIGKDGLYVNGNKGLTKWDLVVDGVHYNESDHTFYQDSHSNFFYHGLLVETRKNPETKVFEATPHVDHS